MLAFRDRNDVRLDVRGTVVRAVFDAPAKRFRPIVLAPLASRQVQPPSEVGARNRVREREPDDDPAVRGHLGMLVEHRRDHGCVERRRSEGDVAFGELDAGCEQIGVQAHSIAAARGPVLGGRKHELIIRFETPLTGNDGVQLNAFFKDLIDQAEARCGEPRRGRCLRVCFVHEVETQGIRHQVAVDDRRDSRGIDRDGGAQRLGQALIDDDTARDDDDEGDRSEQRPGRAP